MAGAMKIAVEHAEISSACLLTRSLPISATPDLPRLSMWSRGNVRGLACGARASRI